MALQFTAHAATRLGGQLRVPGDKSISHRAVMLGSLANGITEVTGFLCGADALATMHAFKSMGVLIDHRGEQMRIHGVGRTGLLVPHAPIDLGNSGTAMRLMMGLLSGQNFDVSLTGDASLCSRPMQRIADPLALMGVNIEMTEGRAPLTIHNQKRDGAQLKAIDYVLPMASAQVKSAILLAGLYADGQSCVTEPAPTRDHTERMLRGFGYAIESSGGQICMQGGGELTATRIDVPADISSAAFFMVATSISPGSQIRLLHVGVNPTRTGVINILREMGADILFENARDVGGEPVADLLISGAPLRGIDIPEAWVPLAIDEIPVIAIAAACASGVTRLTGAEELRVKESDRITAVVTTLTALGIDASETEDGFIIQGKGEAVPGRITKSVFQSARVHSFDDHRIAMAAAVASLRADGPIEIEECDNVATSFPSFVEMANQLGMNIEVRGQAAE